MFAGQDEPILQPFPRSGSCCSVEMCPGKEQQGRKHRGAAGEGRRIQLDVRSQNEPRVFQAEGLAVRSEFYLHAQGLVPDCSDGMAGHKAGNIDPCILQRGEEQRPINPSHQGEESYCLAHTHRLPIASPVWLQPSSDSECSHSITPEQGCQCLPPAWAKPSSSPR